MLVYYQASQIMPFQLEDTSFFEMRDSGSYRHSEPSLQQLRYWISTLRVSGIVLEQTRKEAVELAADVEAARR